MLDMEPADPERICRAAEQRLQRECWDVDQLLITSVLADPDGLASQDEADSGTEEDTRHMPEPLSLPRIDAWKDALGHLLGEVEDAYPENVKGSYPSAFECALHVAREVLRTEAHRLEDRLREERFS
jgi:hypothetical protein